MEGSEATPDEEVNEAHPNEGEIEEAVEDTNLGDSPSEAADDQEESAEAEN